MRKIQLIVPLAALSILVSCGKTETDMKLDPGLIAASHAIIADKPAVDFFEGALLGNGGMGVVVTTRPDGILLYFGHNNVWDIRIAEDNGQEIGTFAEVFEKVKSIPDTLELLTQDPWYRWYSAMAVENYRKPYPRPFPCGSVLLGFDVREAELLGHRLDISNGQCEVYLLRSDGEKLTLQLFADSSEDRLWMRLVDSNEEPAENIFQRVRIMADPSTPQEFPPHEAYEDLNGGMLGFRQVLPYEEPRAYDIATGHAKDRAFSLKTRLSHGLKKTTRINWDGNEQSMAPLEAALDGGTSFFATIELAEGLASELGEPVTSARIPDNTVYEESWVGTKQAWKEFWNKSAVRLGDEFLEQIWYRNLYFFNCAVKAGARTPGLFANWSYNTIGTAWHGDYHMNYNTQQPFWLPFSSNHLEKSLSYVELVEFLMDVSRKWADEYYDLPGAYFPHSAYPVEMSMNPYPVPSWGWEICETPWTVQGLWWHYLYSADTTFLEGRAYEPIKAAVQFLVAYMNRPEARGEQWGDDKYHVFPTIPPELYALRPGFKYNYDCAVDLTLIKFIFQAFTEATQLLGKADQEKELLAAVKDILAHYPPYPTAFTGDGTEVLVSVPGEHSQVVYNLPNALITVFPGEDFGLHSDEKTLELLKNTYLNQQNEGGNDLVFKNLQAARIGMLDLEKFKRQVNYSLMPNGTCSDRVIQVHGRYQDRTNYGFMDRMGIWFENFALPVVINECMLQSYNGIIRLFPNWPGDTDAQFQDLRAVGAFLVSASHADGKVKFVRIRSEAGGTLRIIIPWETGATLHKNGKREIIGGGLQEIETEAGDMLSLQAE